MCVFFVRAPTLQLIYLSLCFAELVWCSMNICNWRKRWIRSWILMPSISMPNIPTIFISNIIFIGSRCCDANTKNWPIKYACPILVVTVRLESLCIYLLFWSRTEMGECDRASGGSMVESNQAFGCVASARSDQERQLPWQIEGCAAISVHRSFERFVSIHIGILA